MTITEPWFIEAKRRYKKHNMNARAYVPVSLQPERGRLGYKCCSLVKGTKTPTIELCIMERPPCGATIVRACQSVETSSSRQKVIRNHRVGIISVSIALTETPIADGEPPARARNDSMQPACNMDGSELRFLGSMTSPNRNGVCGGWTTTRSSRRRWHWHDTEKSCDK